MATPNLNLYLDGETVLGEFSDVAGDVQDDQLPGPSGYVPSNSDVQPTYTHTHPQIPTRTTTPTSLILICTTSC